RATYTINDATPMATTSVSAVYSAFQHLATPFNALPKTHHQQQRPHAKLGTNGNGIPVSQLPYSGRVNVVDPHKIPPCPQPKGRQHHRQDVKGTPPRHLA